MKLKKPVYILSAEQISVQEPLSNLWMSEPSILNGGFHEAIDPAFKQWISPGEARRLGKILKRAVATSAVAMAHSGVECPDAIITATGLGCVKNTELFLTDLCTTGEHLLKPTQFMQSTHNTIGSLVAILNKCHGYNVTYAHGDVSTEIALLDAVTQITLGRISTALVGAHDEMTPNYYTLLERIGYYSEEMVGSGETAVSFMLSSEAKGALCSIDDIVVLHDVEVEKMVRILKDMGPVDCVIAGYNGRPEVDAGYDRMIAASFGGCTILKYKNLFGESMTASAFGVYAGASILSSGILPEPMILKGQTMSPESLVCLNISGNNMAVVKLSICK